MEVEAIVIGAGPAGATAAQRLAARGVSVALIEKTAFPRPKVCGEFVSAPTLALLEALGIGESFLAAAGPPVRRVALYAGGTSVSAPLPPSDRPGRALARGQLDTLLRDAAVATGATLLQPAEVIALEGTPGRMVCRVQRDDTVTDIKARFAIVACGSWNRTGPFAPAQRPGGLLAFKTRFRAARLASDLMPLLAFPGGYGGLVNSDASRLSLSCCIRRDVLQRVRHPGERAADAVLRHMRETTTGLRDVLRDAVPDSDMLSVGPIRPGRRPRYRGGVFFTGNIADEAHPIIADGISMAMQSSWLLTDLLTAHPRMPLDALGARYARAADAGLGLRIAASTLFAQLAMHDASRAVGARIVAVLPALLTWGARASGKGAIPPVLMQNPA